jgi:hypothetical protein
MPAPNVPPIDPAKVAALQALDTPHCIEIASVGWFGAQQWIHYSDAEWDKHFPALAAYNLSDIQARFEQSKWRLEFTRTSDLADDTMSLEFADHDWNITALWWGYGGEGVPVIVTQYFADVDLLVEIFDGYLRTPKESDGFSFPVDCAAGFRSPNLVVPRRVIYTGCSAIFGGLINPTTASPWFPTQAMIDENDCPYNRHIPGGTFGNLDSLTGQPYKDCPRQRPSDCVARLEVPGATPKSYLGFDVVVGTERIGSGKNAFDAAIRANENALKKPLRVVYGVQRVHDLTLLAFEAQSNPNNSDQAVNGFLRCLFAICEGPIVGCGPAQSDPNNPTSDGNPGTSSAAVDSSIRVNEMPIYCNHVDWSGLWGQKRQPKALGGQQGGGLGTQQLNYSGTSIINLDYGRADFRNFQPDSINANAKITGKKDIKTYATPTSAAVRKYTTNRAWVLFDLLTNKRYGYGLAVSRFNIQEWIDLAAWCDETVAGYDDTGTAVALTRSTFNGVVDGRPAAATLGDCCMMGRFTPPFQDQGKLRVLPLRENEAPLTLAGAWTGPTIADYDNDIDTSIRQNIIWESGRSTLQYSIKTDADIPNEITFSFNDRNYDDTERPIVVQDLNAQLLAGRAAGDLSLRAVPKSYSGMGVNSLPEASRLATMLLYYGEYDQGGLQSNFTVKFKTWSVLAKLFGLHPYRVIRILSQRINRFTERGTLEWAPYANDAYEYFRIMKLTRTSKLVLEVEAQLYARSSLNQFAAIPASAGDENAQGTTTTSGGESPTPQPSPVPADGGAAINIKVQ